MKISVRLPRPLCHLTDEGLFIFIFATLALVWGVVLATS